jgi:alpha-beta hydrolase superfamily lysophospholipase
MPNFASSDGVSLYEKVWPASAPKAVAILVHGYGEHIERYAHVAAALNAAGFHARGYDQRGHGQSGGTRGFCMHFSEYLDDLKLVIARATKEWPGLPVFLVAHSFGGLVSCKYLLRDASGITGLVLSSPYFKLKLEVPAIKVMAGKIMSKIIPKLSLPSGLKGADVSRDPDIASLYDRDPLNNKNATARWFTETSSAQEEVAARASEIKLPALVMHGAADKIADPAQTDSIFRKLGSADKQLKMYEGQFHEIFNEPAEDRKKTLNDVTEWLTAHAAEAGKLRARGA